MQDHLIRVGSQRDQDGRTHQTSSDKLKTELDGLTLTKAALEDAADEKRI